MWLSFLVNSLVVTLVVVIHYELLNFLSSALPRLPNKPRVRILVGVFGALFAHSIEVWVFAAAYYLMISDGSLGSLVGNFGGSFFDCVYYSFTSYTTLGFGDIEPQGAVRFLTGIESLVGLVLITWSASFLYLEMERYWTSR